MKPYSETLVGLIGDQLKRIDTSDGYSFTMRAAERFDNEETKTFRAPCAQIYSMTEDKERSGSAWDCLVDVLILVFIQEHEHYQGTTEELEKEVGGDVEFALCQLEEVEEFRATLVALSSVPFSTGDEEQSNDVGVAVTVTLSYRVDFQNPGVPIDPE